MREQGQFVKEKRAFLNGYYITGQFSPLSR